MIEQVLDQWFPIAASHDLPLRHVYQGQLWGRELAVWRADDGHVNVWENRCLHRGVRLSVGLNNGSELKCLYHGWRYANRTAGCTYIPAHPADAPARTICNRTYAGIEAHGLVWSAIAPQGEPSLPDLAEDADPLVLRPMPINASADLVRRYLRGYRFSPDGGQIDAVALDHDSPYLLELTATRNTKKARLMLFLQPVDAGRTVVRGILPQQPKDAEAVLRHHSQLMSLMRTAVEKEARSQPAPQNFDTAFAPVDADLAVLPERSKTGPKTELRVKVARKWRAADCQ